jgi:hypothetical protein
MNPDRVEDIINELRKVTSTAGGVPPRLPPLKPPSGGGNFGDMEARVAKLEAHMEHVRGELAKLASLPVEVATIKTKVEHLPGKGFVVTSAITTVAAVTGLLVLLQRLGVLH